MDQVPPALQQFLTEFKRVANAIVDSYFIVDSERRIVDFNRAFFALLPRQVARGLKGKRCYEVIELNICKTECIAQQCWADNRHVRLDEISGSIVGNRPYFDFRPIMRRSTNGTLVFCDERGPAAARAVIVSYTGRPRVDTVAADGARLVCTNSP